MPTFIPRAVDDGLVISGLVLAGGEGSRLGQGKALAPLAGKPLVGWVVDALRPLTGETILSIGARADPVAYAEILRAELKIVQDRRAGRGPVEGLVSALAATEGDHVCVAPCDAPFLSAEVYHLLMREASGRQGAVPRTEALQPLIGFFQRAPLQAAALQVSHGSDRSPVAIVKRMDVALVGPEKLRAVDPDLLFQFNINTPEDLVKAEGIVARRKS